MDPRDCPGPLCWGASTMDSVPVPYVPVSYLEDCASRWPERPAVLDAGRVVSFIELRDMVHAAAAALKLEGVRPGSVVAVSLPNVWEYVVLELAIPLLGAVVMPLPLGLGSVEREWALARSGAGLVVGKTEAGGLCSTRYQGRVDPAPPDPGRIVEIALTSGTTGLPKLAALSAGVKQATFEGFTGGLQLSRHDRVLTLSPLMQGIGGMCLYCGRLGAAMVMLREPRFSADHALRVATETRSTLLVGVPTNVIRMLDSPSLATADLAAARCTAVAGAPMPPEVARAWEERTGSRICLFYGTMDAGQLAVGSPSDPIEKRWTTVGRVHDCAEAMITPDGEICMRGPTVQDRYWGEERGPYAEDGWAHTGDLGFIDEDGYLHVSAGSRTSSFGAAPTSARTKSKTLCGSTRAWQTFVWSDGHTVSWGRLSTRSWSRALLSTSPGCVNTWRPWAWPDSSGRNQPRW